MIAATFRVSRARVPFGASSICSPMLEPLKSSVSLPAWPSTVSLPSPGSHWKRSSPLPRNAGVGADVAVDEVVALAAEERLGAAGADQRVVAVAAVERDRLVGEGAAALIDADLVVAASRVDCDRRERAAIEAEVGGAVFADVELKNVRCARLKPQRELVARGVAVDLERPGANVCRVRGMCDPCAEAQGCREECATERHERECPAMLQRTCLREAARSCREPRCVVDVLHVFLPEWGDPSLLTTLRAHPLHPEDDFARPVGGRARVGKRRSARFDSANDARPTEARTAADLFDGMGGGRLDEVKARLVVREERRPNVSDVSVAPRELFSGSRHTTCCSARLLCVRARHVRLDQVARHGDLRAEGEQRSPSAPLLLNGDSS